MKNMRKEKEKILASCGCEISKDLIMSTSNGSSCPDCYDKLENIEF